MSSSSDRAPVRDQAEDDAWFPSPYSLSQYTSPKTDFNGANYPNLGLFPISVFTDIIWPLLSAVNYQAPILWADTDKR